MRSLFSRRWILFALAVALLAYGCVWLGEWQFHRLEERKVRNVVTVHNLHADPVPVDGVLAVGRPAAEDDEWQRVRAKGRYAEDQTVIVRYQTREGQSGVDVLTPLVTHAGPALLVDRGWTKSGNSGDAHVDVPPAPSGEVTVVGWVRVNATGNAATVADRSTRAVSSAEIAPTVPFPVYGGFVDAQSESPAPAHPLARAELPDLGNGPHFFYGVQWWFFAALAVFGFFYFAWDERREKRREPAEGPVTTGSEASRRRPAASRR